jgi:signal transduction histidine kinase
MLARMNTTLSRTTINRQYSIAVGALCAMLLLAVSGLSFGGASALTVSVVTALICALLFVVVLWLSNRVTKNIDNLRWAADLYSDNIDTGQTPLPAPMSLDGSVELSAAARSLAAMASGFFDQRTRLQTLNTQLDAQARERTRELNTVLDISQTLARGSEQRALIRDILGAMLTAVPFRSASIWMREHGEILLKSFFKPGESEARVASDGLRLSNSQGRIYRMLERKREPIVVNRARRSLFEWLLSQLVDSYAASLYQGAQSWMAVPLAVHEDMIGAMHIDSTDAEYFTPERERLLIAIGQQAALAIEHSRLRAQAEQAAVMAERNRIARDLHDAVSQTLFAASITAGTLEAQLTANPDEARRQIAQLQKLNRGALAEMRMLLFELRPDALRATALSELLQHAADAAGTQMGITINAHTTTASQPPSNVKTQLYRIAQEALNNAARHSGATQVDLDLTSDEAGVFRLAVRDNGRGFATDVRKPGHFGLENMQARAEEIGAKLIIESVSELGTTVTLTWPTDEQDG